MIRYALKCDKDHGFESWFADGAAFESLLTQGALSCPHCGSTRIEKSLMAPMVRPSRRATGATGENLPAAAPAGAGGTLSGEAVTGPPAELAEMIAALRKHVQENSEYVGKDFADEARRMHEGEAEARPIYGEARMEEARQLIEDGIPVAPLPFLPSRKVN